LKIKAVDIQSGDRIVAYCNNKMQVCTVKCILDPDLTNINLSVATSEASRNSISRVVRFRLDALVELHAKGANALADSSSPDEEVVARPTSPD
jgi:hypothetical protein